MVRSTRAVKNSSGVGSPREPGIRTNPNGTKSGQPGVRPSVGLGANGRVSKGVQKKGSTAVRVSPVVSVDETPVGFKIDTAQRDFILGRGRGGNGNGMSNAGSMMDSVDDGFDDGDASGGGSHDDGHDDHYGDHHDDHHDHHDSWNIDINFNFYSNRSSPNGWWYLYGDYDGDGYTDYVCTNGYRSVYWYGWTGYYWGASPWYGWYGSRSGYSYSWWNYSSGGRYNSAIYGSGGDLSSDPSYATSSMDQGPMGAGELPQAMPMSALEVARLEMSLGEPDIAIEAYRSHLSEYPSDWLTVRELGIAKIRAGDRGDGIALVSYAYSMDPSLATSALPVSVFEDSSRLLRDSVIDVVGWGHRNPSASVWLTVAVLMQAEGRDGPALRMIERAYEHGLDGAVDREMRLVLTRR